MQHNTEVADNNGPISDFATYHHNWADTVLHRITGLLHALSPDGSILYCSDSCIELTGYQPNELVGRSITDYIHMGDLQNFIHKFQYAFHSMSRVKIYYRLRCKDNSYLLLEFVGQPKRELTDNTPSFFAIAQPYLSRSNGLIDSYMEIKMECDWFKKRIYELLSSQRVTPQDFNTTYYQMPIIPFHMDAVGGSNSLDETHVVLSPHSDWRLNQYTPSDGSSIEEIIPQILPNEKWKRIKIPESYLCNDCGVTSSPEWRKGPNGPKTLCNACGLRWAKKNKRDLKENRNQSR